MKELIAILLFVSGQIHASESIGGTSTATASRVPSASPDTSESLPAPSPEVRSSSSPTKRASVSASPVPMSTPQPQSAFLRFVNRLFRTSTKSPGFKPAEMVEDDRLQSPDEQEDSSSDDEHEEQITPHTPGVSDSLSVVLDPKLNLEEYAARYGLSPSPFEAVISETGAASGGGAIRSTSSPAKRPRRSRLHTKKELQDEHQNTDDENTDDEI